MRGNPRNQAGQIFRPLVRIGHSRHADKDRARLAGHSGSHQIAQHTSVYSYQTLTTYRKITAEFLQFVRDEYEIKDAAKVTPEHLRHFLQTKIANGKRYKTFQTYGAALNKAAVGLQKITGRNPGWSDVIKDLRQDAKRYLNREVKPRAYERPAELIEQLSEHHQTAARLQYECGARVKEIAQLTERNLISPGRIKLTNTKGGRIRIVEVPEDLWQKVAETVQNAGAFEIKYQTYRRDLKAAALSTGQPFNGTHGLRWNFAQDQARQIQDQGHTYNQALQIVAEKMGHSRPEITEHYLQ